MSTIIYRFTASWCNPCKDLTDMLSNMQLEVPIRVIDVDKEPELVKEYQVRGVPTLIQLKEGKVASRLVGAVTPHELDNWLATAKS